MPVSMSHIYKVYASSNYDTVVVAILIKIVGLRHECDRRVFLWNHILIKTAYNVVGNVCAFVLFTFPYKNSHSTEQQTHTHRNWIMGKVFHVG